jgi:hypothetical protein
LEPRLETNDGAIHRALARGKTADLEEDPVYQRVFALAEISGQPKMPYAAVPNIELHGPKITRRLTTQWYANRVNGRFERCLKRRP